MKDFFLRIKAYIEKFIPMTVGNMAIFAFLIYLIFVVGQSVVANHRANQDIAVEEAKLAELRGNITNLQNEINYYQTNSFKEKEARAKLGYKAPGEIVIALPIDTEKEKSPDNGLAQQEIKEPNYILWWKYFFGS